MLYVLILTFWNSYSTYSLQHNSDWGFFGHRLINKQAVYAVPNPLRGYIIGHIDYLSAHAVDPDKRRYATKIEAFQHYFDTEKWEAYLNEDEYDRHDLIRLVPSWLKICKEDSTWIKNDSVEIERLLKVIPKSFTGNEWEIDGCIYVDTMAHHGLLPITLIKRYHQLVKAFSSEDATYILKCMSDIGHYLADAHVPLHTTQNYNGQLSNQLGIHAFWETSVPELLASDSFDLVVGRAYYIDDIKQEVWRILRHSNGHVDQVLSTEKELRRKWPDDEEECPIRRTGGTVFGPCPEFTAAYHESIGGMVESQMQLAIKSVASFWWSAYVDAGQPPLSCLSLENSNSKFLEIISDDTKMKGHSDRRSE